MAGVSLSDKTKVFVAESAIRKRRRVDDSGSEECRWINEWDRGQTEDQLALSPFCAASGNSGSE